MAVTWLVACADAGTSVLDRYLQQGYEPFAVTTAEEFPDRVYLRKQINR